MNRLNFSISINAPKEKVWNIMLDHNSYRVWTEVFAPGSHYVGNWEKGSKILFLAPNKSGQMGGMVSQIKEIRKYEYISIEHCGVVNDGREDTSSEEGKTWAGALENYTFKENNGITELLVEMDSAEEYENMFKDLWPKALQKLKELAEEK
jgi:hypothetical protein